MKPTAEQAERIKDAVIAAVPEKTDLIYIDQGDQLSDDQLKAIFDGRYTDAEELAWEFECESRRYGIGYELDEMNVDDIVANILCENLDEDEDGADYTFEEFRDDHDEHWEEIREVIENRDESTPFDDLIRATPDQMMRFRFDVPPNYDETDLAGAAKMIREAFQITDPTFIQKFIDAHADYDFDGYAAMVWYADITQVVHVLAADAFENEGSNSEASTIKWSGDMHLFIGDWAYVEFSGTAQAWCSVGTFELDDNDDWHKPAFKCRYSIVNTFEDYRNDLVTFYEYRAKLMETRAS